jgi:hypothetical protein
VFPCTNRPTNARKYTRGDIAGGVKVLINKVLDWLYAKDRPGGVLRIVFACDRGLHRSIIRLICIFRIIFPTENVKDIENAFTKQQYENAMNEVNHIGTVEFF